MTDPISLSFSKTSSSKSDTVVVTACKGAGLGPSARQLDEDSAGLLSAALKARTSFKGRHGDVVSIIFPEKSRYRQALLIGLGDKEKLDALALENAGGKTLLALKAVGAVSAAVFIDHEEDYQTATAAQTVTAFASGMRLRDYAFDKYKSPDTAPNGKDKPLILKSVTIVTPDAPKATKDFTVHKNLAEGVLFARDLVNEAPNVLYPQSYADLLQKTLKPLGVEVDVFDEKKMQKLGFGAHLAVGMGSARPPRVVVMRWRGVKASKKKQDRKGPLAFVGKGVTFDTGGISIKPAAGMEEMKTDMGGSAAVAGLIYALAASKVETDIIGIVGLAENMPSDRAYRPGDIVTSLSGKTIEILNTDAEGRLVLADALTYVQDTYSPSMIIDLATLTGAIMVALGHEYAGVFANNDTLWKDLENASRVTGEKIWRMPLDEAYRDEMKGTISDLRNLGNLGRYGGACSAAGFLESFVDTETPWAHIDIAGTAFAKSDRATIPKGASGYGVRLLYQMVTAKEAA